MAGEEKKRRKEDFQEIRILIPKGILPFKIPDETRIHARRAVREGLLALRSIIDARIKRIEDEIGDVEKKAKLKRLPVE